jgi:hypothetical protein
LADVPAHDDRMLGNGGTDVDELCCYTIITVLTEIEPVDPSASIQTGKSTNLYYARVDDMQSDPHLQRKLLNTLWIKLVRHCPFCSYPSQLLSSKIMDWLTPYHHTFDQEP